MGIDVTDEIRKDVNEMCNYGDYLYSKGEMKGEMETYFLLVQDGGYFIGSRSRKKGMDKKEFISEMEKAGYKVPVMA